MVPIAETKPTVREEKYATPIVEPIAQLLKVMIQDSPREVSIDGKLMEMVPKMSIEGRSEKNLTEIVWMEKVIDNLGMDLTTTIETGGSLEIATPVEHFLIFTSHARPLDLMPHAPSTGEILQSTVVYLKNLLLPAEKLFLNEQRGER